MKFTINIQLITNLLENNENTIISKTDYLYWKMTVERFIM